MNGVLTVFRKKGYLELYSLIKTETVITRKRRYFFAKCIRYDS